MFVYVYKTNLTGAVVVAGLWAFVFNFSRHSVRRQNFWRDGIKTSLWCAHVNRYDAANFMYSELDFGRTHVHFDKNLATNVKIYAIWTPDAWNKHCSQISMEKKTSIFQQMFIPKCFVIRIQFLSKVVRDAFWHSAPHVCLHRNSRQNLMVNAGMYI